MRNTACVMLFVWLFALASGVANACLLEPYRVHEQGSPLSQPAPEYAAVGVTGHHADGFAHDDHDSDSVPTRESCLKACDEGSQTMLKHASSFDLVDPGLAPFVAVAWAAVMHVASEPGRAHDFRLPERGPPIRVLYSRLAL